MYKYIIIIIIMSFKAFTMQIDSVIVTTADSCIIDYNHTKKNLIAKYGKPVIDTMEWNNSFFKNNETKYNFAVSFDFLKCRTIWKNNNTKVMLLLFGYNGIPILLIHKITE